MPGRLAIELEQFAAAILAAQQQMLDLLRRKRAALVASDLAELDAFHVPETQAAERLQAMIAWRETLLAKANQAGFSQTNLTNLAQRIGRPPNHAGELLKSSRRIAAELQRESWVHWILANRCTQHCRELIDRIAHGGKRAPTYQPGEPSSGVGGALLNASA
jgi:hypothetical protein